MITLHPLLIKSILVSSFLFLNNSYAEDLCSKKVEVLALVDGEYGKHEKIITNLYCDKGFVGKDFKIVNESEDRPISFNDHPELMKSAANTYYHLTLAKKYWLGNFDSAIVKNLGQLTVRINITNDYSEYRQFTNTEQSKNYNNARTTPAGETHRFEKIQKSWGREIWFRPKKIIKTDKTKKSVGKNPVYQSLELVREPIWDLNMNGLIYQGLSLVADNNLSHSSSFIDSAVSRVGTLAFLYAAVHVTKGMDNYFTNDEYYINSAMIPEIIYHEFAHIALSDTLEPVHHVPIIEGMADYFVARMVDEEVLYKNIEGHSMNQTKDVLNESLYNHYLEEAWNATGDFVLSLIWKAKINFDKANGIRVEKGNKPIVDFDQLVFDSHLLLNEESDILYDLPQALIDVCNTSCKSKRKGNDILFNSFEQKGMN
jgi:hypothetical protein